MWYTVQKDTTYAFELQRGTLAPSPAIEQTLGPFLLSGLSHVEHLKEILQRLDLTAAANYFAHHVASKENVRIGDFGEIVAGRLLEEAEAVTRPVEKLRYRESPDWPMKLIDVFCVRIDGDRITSFMFGEAKAGTTPPRIVLGQEAYRQLYQEVEGEEPQILFFTLDKLLDANNRPAYLQLEDAMNRTLPVPRALRIVFVFDEASWRDKVLSILDEGFQSDELVLADDFKCYVLTRDGLKAVIADTYAEAERIAAHG